MLSSGSGSLSSSFFLFFIFLISFGLGNVVVASVCFTSIQNANAERARQIVQDRVMNENLLMLIADCFNAADKDGSGSLDVSEIRTLFERPQIKKAMHAMGVPIHDFETLLKLLDRDGDGEITRNEFVQGFLQFKGIGGNSSLNKLLLSLQALTIRGNTMHRRLCKCRIRLKKLEEQFSVAFLAVESEIAIRKDPLAARKRDQHRAKKQRRRGITSGPPSCAVSVIASTPSVDLRERELAKERAMMSKPLHYEDKYEDPGTTILPVGVPVQSRHYVKQARQAEGFNSKEMRSRLDLYSIKNKSGDKNKKKDDEREPEPEDNI